MVRYLLLQPRKSLQTLSLEGLGKWIVSQVELLAAMPTLQQPDKSVADAQLSQQVALIRNYLQRNVPQTLHDKLAIEILQALTEMCEKYDLSMVYEDDEICISLIRVRRFNSCGSHGRVINRMIEVVFTRSLTSLSLDFDGFPISCPAVFCSKPQLLTGLVNLELSSSETKNIKEKSLIDLLKELHYLKKITLSLNSICTNNTVKCIVDNCKLIEYLDLKNNTLINDSGADMLIQLPNLRSVCLENTAVSVHGIEKILWCCENIEELGTGVQTLGLRGSSNEITNAIVNLSKIYPKRFKLRKYKNGSETTLERLQTVVKMCPRLQDISLNKNNNAQSNLMKALHNVEDLYSLKLNSYRFYSDGVIETLHVRGSNLVEFSVIAMNEVDLNALMCIVKMCPNLEALCMHCRFVPRAASNIINCETSIKTLTLETWSEETKPTDEQILFLLANSPKIETICTGLEILITDDILLKVLERNPMIHLKDLRINGQLTSLSIDKITQCCSSRPEILIDE